MARIGTVALVAFLLAMAVLPLASTGARAANDDSYKIDSTVVDPSATTAQDAGDDVSLGDPPAPATPDDPTAYGTIQVAKYGCDDDYDGNYYDLAANCAPMSAPFAVNSGNGEQDFDGGFTADNVAAGFVTVTEALPDGYGNPIAFCDSYLSDGSESGFAQAQLNDSTLSYDLKADEYLYCDWFNVPANGGILVDGGDSSVVIHKLLCPVGYDATAKSDDELAADCTQPQDGIGFSLTQDDAVVVSGATGDQAPGEVDFTGLFPSGYTIHEDLPAGYLAPVVFCSLYGVQDDAFLGALTLDVHNAAVDVDMDNGQWIGCDWFNIPSEDGTITIHKWECPQGLAFVQEPSGDDLLQACAQAQDGVSFDLAYPDDPQAQGQTKVTGDDGSGTVVFDGVAPGNATVTEQIPSGYGTPIVNCGWGATYDAQNNGQLVAVDGYIPMLSVPNGELDLEWLPNEQMSCDWFNIPSDGGTIVVHKWVCPSGWDASGADYGDLTATCTDPMSGIDFTLEGDGYGLIGVQNTDDTGLATFANVPGGDLTLTEAIPTGYGTPIVFCSYAQGEEYQQDLLQSGTFAFEYGGNAVLFCDWFNVPTGHGSITVYKYTCPAGYNLFLAADPKADCTDLTNGITFTLTGGSIGTSQSTTGDSIPGAVYWGGLDPDTYTIDESVPAGTVDTRVFCQWYDAAGAFDSQDIQPYNKYGSAGLGGTIDLELHATDDIVCLWFNAPGASGGELVVTKYWCDGNVYDTAHCDIYGGGADFELDAAYGSYSTQFTTGADGTAHLSLTAGEYALNELNRDWCRAESDQVDGDGYVVIADGATSYVTVYNCGPGKVKEPPVKKFPNTGAGTVVADAGRSGSETEIALAVAAMILLASTGLALRRTPIAA